MPRYAAREARILVRPKRRHWAAPRGLLDEMARVGGPRPQAEPVMLARPKLRGYVGDRSFGCACRVACLDLAIQPGVPTAAEGKPGVPLSHQPWRPALLEPEADADAGVRRPGRNRIEDA